MCIRDSFGSVGIADRATVSYTAVICTGFRLYCIDLIVVIKSRLRNGIKMCIRDRSQMGNECYGGCFCHNDIDMLVVGMHGLSLIHI